MSSIGLYKVLYIGKTPNTAEAPEDEKALNAVADNLKEFAAEFEEAYTELQVEEKTNTAQGKIRLWIFFPNRLRQSLTL